jgi:hypothetical protein
MFYKHCVPNTMKTGTLHTALRAARTRGVNPALSSAAHWSLAVQLNSPPRQNSPRLLWLGPQQPHADSVCLCAAPKDAQPPPIPLAQPSGARGAQRVCPKVLGRNPTTKKSIPFSNLQGSQGPKPHRIHYDRRTTKLRRHVSNRQKATARRKLKTVLLHNGNI